MSVPRLHRRPGSRDPLAELLAATAFRLGPHTTRVAANLTQHGGEIDDGATAWIGADLPPLGAPSVSLAQARGTLGPHSFGFLDNLRGIAPFAAPLPARPRPGPIALVCPRRDAMVDVGPLVVSRDLGISWIISVGDGDPEDVLRVLAADSGTRAVLLVPGDGTRPQSLRALNGKPAAVLGGPALVKAQARRSRGWLVTDDLEEWLAFAQVTELDIMPPYRPRVIVAGAGGGALITQQARSTRLDLPVISVDDDDPVELRAQVAQAAHDAELLLLAGIPREMAPPASKSLVLDLTAPARIHALLSVLAQHATPPPAPLPRVRADRARALAVLNETDAALGDHDTKRILHAYGVRVSRQAPANSPTGALRIAQQLGFPVDVVVPPEAQAESAATRRKAGATAQIRRAAAPTDLRRAAGVLLEEASFVLIREAFPQASHHPLTVRQEAALGSVARIGEERAVLPLTRDDAEHLARAAGADTAAKARALVDTLARITAAAQELGLDLDVELYLGDPPAVVSAAARRVRPPQRQSEATDSEA